MRTFGFCLIGLVAGYVIGGLLGAGAVQLLSANTHDKSVEMAMTGGLVTGPISALVGLVAVWIRARRTAN